MEGRRDGIVSIQHTGRQILVQTRAGLVALFDAETGRLAWRVHIGEAYRVAYTPAFNSASIFAVNGTVLYSLDRSNGALQWELSLPGGLSAPPVADDEQVFISTGTGTVYAYRPLVVEVPDPSGPLAQSKYGPADVSIGKKDERLIEVVRPVRQWQVASRLRIDLPGVQEKDTLLIPAPTGELLGLVKLPLEGSGPEGYRFPLDTSFSAGPGAFNGSAYLPGRDGYLYAFDIRKAQVLWRQLVSSSALTRTPVVTERDLFVVSEREGMARLDRVTGNPLWRIPRGDRVLNVQAEADRFLAASPKFVYALDRSGRLLILDRVRGFLLSRFDVRDFVVPVVNEQTDRLYLAANNGLILCLRDIDYPLPQRERIISTREAEAGKTPDERARDLKDRLSKPANLNYPEPQPLNRFLDDLRKNQGIKSFFSEKSYREENKQPPPPDVKVKVQKKPTLGEVIQDVLSQIDATYYQLGDQLFIIPKPKGKPKP